MSKQEEEFNFMLESKDSPSSPKAKHSSITHSMSASKLLELAKKEELPYIFSQKKVTSFHYEGNLAQNQNSFKMGQWILQWWEQPSYGLFYQTSNGTLGCRFNDGINIKSHPFPNKLTLIEESGQQMNLNSQKIQQSTDKKQLLGKLKVMKQMTDKLGLKA